MDQKLRDPWVSLGWIASDIPKLCEKPSGVFDPLSDLINHLIWNDSIGDLLLNESVLIENFLISLTENLPSDVIL